MKKIFRKILRVIAWIVTSVVGVMILLALLIQIPAVQLKVTQKAVALLEEKIGTDVSLEGIRIGFPKNIVLEGIYVEDQRGDTLLYAGKLSINTDLWALTNNEIQLNDIALQNTVAFVHRAESDSPYNFTFILDAFAGDSTVVADTLEQKGWDFSLQALTLRNIRLQYHDLLVGNHAALTLGQFELEMNEFDLHNNRFGIEQILLADTRANFKQTKLPPLSEQAAQAADSTSALILSLETFGVENVDVDYEQALLGQVLELKVGEFNVEADEIDLQNRQIILNSIFLAETFIGYHQHPADTTLVPHAESDDTNASGPEKKSWQLALANLDFKDNSAQYNNFAEPHQRGSLDFNHLSITHLDIDARNIRYEAENINGDLRNLSFREQSGFAVNSLQGKIKATKTQALLDDLHLLTGNSRLQLQASATFPSLRNIGETWSQANLKSDIDDSYVSVKDILYFEPSFLDSLPLALPPTANLRVDATLQGAIDDLNIEHLVFGMLSETTLITSGTITGLPDIENLRMDLAVDKFYATRKDLDKILPDTLLPDSMHLPDWMNLEGQFRGTMKKAMFTSRLTSGLGAIHLEGNMNLDSTSATRGLQATVDVCDLDVGTILGKPDSVMGNLNMHAAVNANGLSPAEMGGTLTVLIGQFDYKGYRYNDLSLKGNIRDQVLSVEASIEDQNLDFTFDAGYDFNDEVPRYNVALNIKNADFEALNLSTSPLRGRGTLTVDMATSDFKVLNGNVSIRKVAIFDGDDLYAVDSLLFASIDQEGKSEINIDSDLLTAKFEGSINIFSLPGVVTAYFNSYYTLHDSLEAKDAARQHFNFNIDIRNTDILTGLLVPQLESFVPGEITGEFDSEAKVLDLRMEIDKIQYGSIDAQSFVFTTNSNEDELNYNFMVDRIMFDSMKIDGMESNGTVANDSIQTNLIILDSADTDKYVLAGTFYSRDDVFELRLVPDGIILNYEPWSVPENNYMRFGEAKFVAQNVRLTNRREQIIIESDRRPDSPVHVAFRELNLEYLSSMIAMQRPLSGLLEGDINFYSDSTAVTFTSDIAIDNLRIRGIPWGNMSLQVEQRSDQRFAVNFGLTGNRNNITANGFYQDGESPAMDLTAQIEQFNLASLQPLVANQFKNMRGTVVGEIRARGTPQRPDVDGSVRFRDTKFLSHYLNTTFAIDDETISFTDEGISFDAFEIADQNGNIARLNGTILTQTYRDFSFNLDLFTDHFRLLNTSEGDNELFYGSVEIGATARIRGNMTTPVINMAIGLSENSHLTYVVPQSEAAVLKTEGIVKFVDKTFKDDPFMERTMQEVSDTLKSTFRGIDLTARIELSDQERLTIVIDPLTQDQLTIRGNSTLTLNIDPTGDIHLTGRYEISEGTYNLSFYKFVKRKFEIDKGSSITWTGDPLNAQMDIRAIYTVQTSPIPLFSNQLTGVDQSEINRYRQRLPFMVYLNITGELLQPEISFQLEMPMDKRNVFGGTVYARIQDINTRESNLNKQVFALLILKRFIADNPFENNAGGGFESTARRSVSKILSEQLNRLSENIKGVELSFDIRSYEDYSTGEAEGKTELQLGFSKSFLNDRLVVKLSGNINIEDPEDNREATDYIGDLAVEYKLTADGRFRITGFRNSNYDMIDGELIETGVGLIYVKDYNSLSELFDANAETKN